MSFIIFGKFFYLAVKMNLLRGKAREKYNIEVRKASLAVCEKNMFWSLRVS